MAELDSKDLIREYENAVLKHPKAAAEIAYAIAVEHIEDDPRLSIDYACKSIQLYVSLKIETLEDATPVYFRINQTYLPDMMHEDVVRDRFRIEKKSKKCD